MGKWSTNSSFILFEKIILFILLGNRYFLFDIVYINSIIWNICLFILKGQYLLDPTIIGTRWQNRSSELISFKKVYYLTYIQSVALAFRIPIQSEYV